MNYHTSQLPLFITSSSASLLEIPFGFCACGCGQKTSIAKQTISARGVIRGQPFKFIAGHQAAKPRVAIDESALPPGTRAIPLTQGKVAIVDASDHDELSQFKWHAHKQGRTYYAVRNAPRGDGTYATVKMHVAIMGQKGVDHIDGDGLRNTRDNLRLATQQQNQFNQKPHVDGTSMYKGVYWYKGAKKWMARITINGKGIHLGYFDDETEAARAYDAKAKELFGEFARLNFKERI